jgi:hypothetical protein
MAQPAQGIHAFRQRDRNLAGCEDARRDWLERFLQRIAIRRVVRENRGRAARNAAQAMAAGASLLDIVDPSE